MKTVVIANPKAANGSVGKQWSRHKAAIVEVLGEVEVRLTGGPGQATDLTRRSIEEGFERVVVVGGDGTINEAVNGFFDSDSKPHNEAVSLAYYPAGTGGDFARSIGLSGSKMLKALEEAQERPMDVGRASLVGHDGQQIVRHFINISSFGSSGLIVDKVNKSTKILGGKASFMLGTVKGLLSYKNKRIRLTIDDHIDEEMVINTVAVANGRFFGGSMMIAPHAIVDDGSFDIVVIGDIGVRTFIRHSSRIYDGTHLNLPDFRELRGKKVTATPIDGEVLIDLDGEQPGRLPVTYEVVPKALRMFAPWNRAVAIGDRGD